MNPLFSKLVSLILLILILFSIFRYIYLDYSTYKQNNPYLIEYETSISSHPPIASSKFNVSEDRRNGIEFTYALWLNIDSIDNSFLFKKGDDDQLFKLSVKSASGDEKSYNIPDHSQRLVHLDLEVPIFEGGDDSKCLNKNETDCLAPCYWQNDGTNTSVNKCKMINCDVFNPGKLETMHYENNTDILGSCDSYDFCKVSNDAENSCSYRKTHNLIIQNIPYKKWFHLSLIFINKYVDVYINGNLYNRFELANIIKQNNSDLEFGTSGSKIMRFQYFNYALPNYKIQSLVSDSGINVDPNKNKYIDGNFLNKNYWVKDNLANKYLYT